MGRSQTAKGKKESNKYVCWVRTLSLISDLLLNLDTPSESSADSESIRQQKKKCMYVTLHHLQLAIMTNFSLKTSDLLEEGQCSTQQKLVLDEFHSSKDTKG